MSRPWLQPLVPVYRLALALREMRLRSGLEPVRRLRWPVISIGNLSTGGTGKTPLTIALARTLTARGTHVDVLSRGYGRRSALPLQVNPSGTAEDFGDEPLLIAREAGVPVYVAAQRYEAGLMAEAAWPQNEGESQQVRAHILDDGFQHRQLHRDVDIVLINRHDWLDRLLPAGNLREPLRALFRASVIAIPAEDPQFEAELKAFGWQGPIWRLRRKMEIDMEDGPVDGPVAAFCGIARPGQFFHGLEKGGLRLAARIPFPDHYQYTEARVRHLLAAAESTGATALMTTEKDLVRLGHLAAMFPESLPLKTAHLTIEIEDEAAAMEWLVAKLK
jgi:tetraacyldisaccharide 4'-kinase